MKMALGLMLATTSLIAQAADCNCQEVTGACLGSIEFVKSFGSKPSYGAEIIVHSSESRCSKVEYFVDGTPYQTILVNRRSAPESLFGTSPIAERNVTFSTCKVCASGTGLGGGGDADAGSVSIDPQLKAFVFNGYCDGCSNTRESIALGRMISDRMQGLTTSGASIQVSLERFQPAFAESGGDAGVLTNDLAIRVVLGKRTAVISNSQRAVSFDKHAGKEAYLRARNASVQNDVLEVVNQLQQMLGR